MDKMKIALFGETEKGEYRTAYYCQTLPQLIDFFGNPPPESYGLYYAIQALLYHREIIFFRVQEEGFSLQDYELGLYLLQNQQTISTISAICVPGLGDTQMINKMIQLCFIFNSVLIAREADLYDYLTDIPA